MRQKLRVDADAGIPHLNARSLAFGAHRYRHLTLFGELDGVPNDVVKNAMQAGRVGRNHHGVVLGVKVQGEAFLFGEGRKQQHGLPGLFGEVERLASRFEAFGLELCEVEHRVDRLQQAPPAPLDEVSELAVLLTDLLPEHACEADDAGQRGANLMAHVGEEGALVARQLLCVLARGDEGLLEPLAVRDVLPRRVDAPQAALLVADGAAAVADPALLARFRDDPQFDFDRLSDGEAADLRLGLGAVVFVDERDEVGHAGDLVGRVAGDAPEGPEGRDGPVAAFALAQRGLGLRPLLLLQHERGEVGHGGGEVLLVERPRARRANVLEGDKPDDAALPADGSDEYSSHAARFGVRIEPEGGIERVDIEVGRDDDAMRAERVRTRLHGDG